MTHDVCLGRYTTRQARVLLWNEWAHGHLECVFTRILDEEILRSEPILKDYWAMRDKFDVKGAENFIVRNEEAINAVISFPVNAHGRTTAIFRTADLCICGQGGDSHSLDVQLRGGKLKKKGNRLDDNDDDDIFATAAAAAAGGASGMLKGGGHAIGDDSGSEYSSDGSSDAENGPWRKGKKKKKVKKSEGSGSRHNNRFPVPSSMLSPRLVYDDVRPLCSLALDSGTWPADGGGVASCRRDVVDRLQKVRWFMVSEVGNPMKIIHGAYQIERNIAYTNTIHLWGRETGGPNHTIMSDVPYGVISHKIGNTYCNSPMPRSSHGSGSGSASGGKQASERASGSNVERYFAPILRALIVACQVCE